ncbi:ABC transporter substrate-binding protein [Actinacidiphila bryophytorum]|uniref:ABC-type branched-chain amino acid transport system, substrate-binding protein n=1 Tax=Actinacidiphila bryophytorum TaxID=1436133 RepID=A0A9W4H151_9ACTN|nr:ABC transporter substrate-binding protein [Actinacidiphila bryophytorum]MBM9434888.1 ABC transporter substrate-binding protein [Actinacidiphila bryophytorum]MBN6544395.1 ABC transporter substrate-binding protein [Actinacidiphila bryophytorum]CAG7641026.1 ABC-type branched-chain amino acid transport system, substrate-binding protein [Actinacidiphila bryophytorum]
MFATVRAYVGHLPVGARRLLAVVCVLALAAVGYGVYVPVDHLLNKPCMRKGATAVVHHGSNGECVGITDGSYVFHPTLRDAEEAIRKENRDVLDHHATNYVSVVLMLPISADKGSILSMPNALEQLQGAFTAQHYANRNNVEGITPYVQLLIGSDGYQANAWQSAVSTIVGDHSRHIAAVTGFGLSLAGTESAIKELTAHSIPAFGATLTSDNYDNIKGFVRASPSNVDNMAAALSYVESDYKRAVLVEDGNADDSYDVTLVSGFRKFSAIPGHRIVGVEPYDTSERDRDGQSAEERRRHQTEVATRISQMTTNICAAQPAVVLFAGRGQDLGVLVHAFSNTCLDKQIRIVSGDDVTNLPDSEQLRQDLRGHVTVDYAGVAHPGEWSDSAGHDQAHAAAAAEGAQGFRIFDTAFHQLFPRGYLGDGNAMMAYDATLTATAAIRLTEQQQPQPDAVVNELGALQGAHKVLGASGPIQFTANYQTSRTGSNPVAKPIPIIRLTPQGNPRVLTVKWPDEAPPVG